MPPFIQRADCWSLMFNWNLKANTNEKSATKHEFSGIFQLYVCLCLKQKPVDESYFLFGMISSWVINEEIYQKCCTKKKTARWKKSAEHGKFIQRCIAQSISGRLNQIFFASLKVSLKQFIIITTMIDISFSFSLWVLWTAIAWDYGDRKQKKAEIGALMVVFLIAFYTISR